MGVRSTLLLMLAFPILLLAGVGLVRENERPQTKLPNSDGVIVCVRMQLFGLKASKVEAARKAIQDVPGGTGGRHSIGAKRSGCNI